MFKDYISNRVCLRKDGYEMIKGLKTSISLPTVQPNNDALDNIIMEMFNETEELENTVLEIHDDYTGIPDNEITEQNTERSSDVTNISGAVSILSISNVFLQGRSKMTKMKIPQVRIRKQNRIQIAQAFFLDINDTVIRMESNIDIELDRISNVSLFNPWYRMAYRQISN